MFTGYLRPTLLPPYVTSLLLTPCHSPHLCHSFGDTARRSRLARGTLDVLGMGKVPVGMGEGDPHIGNTCSTAFANNYIPSKAWKPYRAPELLKKLYTQAEDKSIDVCIIAAMTDFAHFVEAEPELFSAKTRRVNIMGGAKPRVEGADNSVFFEPDDSYNCFCDEEASELAFQKCQEVRSGVRLASERAHTLTFLFLTSASYLLSPPQLRIPMTILSRHSAYKAPLQRGVYELMAKTGNPIANRLLSEQKQSIGELWKRAVSPPNSAGRMELPDRCDRKWFIATFMGGPSPANASLTDDEDVWPHIRSFNMYDPLSCIAAMEENAKFLKGEVVEINGVEHWLIGTTKEEHGMVEDKVDDLKEYMLERFLQSMNAPKLPENDDEVESDIIMI